MFQKLKKAFPSSKAKDASGAVFQVLSVTDSNSNNHRTKGPKTSPDGGILLGNDAMFLSVPDPTQAFGPGIEQDSLKEGGWVLFKSGKIVGHAAAPPADKPSLDL
jgi:hypothetical protein